MDFTLRNSNSRATLDHAISIPFFPREGPGMRAALTHHDSFKAGKYVRMVTAILLVATPLIAGCEAKREDAKQQDSKAPSEQLVTKAGPTGDPIIDKHLAGVRLPLSIDHRRECFFALSRLPPEKKKQHREAIFKEMVAVYKDIPQARGLALGTFKAYAAPPDAALLVRFAEREAAESDTLAVLIDILGDMKNPETIPFLVSVVESKRSLRTSGANLHSFGTLAESELLEAIARQRTKDKSAASDLIACLVDCGSEASLDLLRSPEVKNDPALRNNTEVAIRAIEARAKEKGKK